MTCFQRGRCYQSHAQRGAKHYIENCNSVTTSMTSAKHNVNMHSLSWHYKIAAEMLLAKVRAFVSSNPEYGEPCQTGVSPHM